MKPKHPLADLYAEEIERVRKGDVAAAQMMMLHCAVALREQQPDGRNNLPGQHAEYLAEVLEELAQKDSTAKLFCLDMPGNRPKLSGDSPIHLERARKVLAKFQSGGTLKEAFSAVATEEHRSPGPIRRSWELKGHIAETELLLATPRPERGKVRLPSAALLKKAAT